jgi:hypothetical protein
MNPLDETGNFADMLTDPVRDELARLERSADLDYVRGLYSPTTGEAAFDAGVIRGNLERLETTPPVSTGHELLDLSVRTGLAFIDATFQGDHPKYGVWHYAEERHDGFPPTIIATVDALTAWGIHDRAMQLFRHWLVHFVNADGSIRYYGPSLSEYGQLLHTAATLHERAGAGAWLDDGRGPLARIADRLLALCREAEAKGDLIPGVPEADISRGEPNNIRDVTHNEDNRFFHNNAWVARGLLRWATLGDAAGLLPASSIAQIREAAQRLIDRTLASIEATWPTDPADWWLSPQVEPAPRPAALTATRLGSYTNYRYWPELLSSGVLPDALGHRLVESRLTGGGQFCGMTRLGDHLDDWPLADYLFGLWRLGRRDDFLLSLYGHIAYHQADGHLTAYEQVTMPPSGTMKAPYCLPCQLVAARAARLLVQPALRSP